MLKKVLIHTRRSIKIVTLIAIALLIILAIVAYFYKISYNVIINGESIGYTDNKSELQTKINNYIENGEGENIAFVQVDELPQYNICLLKRNVKANDDEIFEKIKSSGTEYYRYYAILNNQEEKEYVLTFAEAEEVVNQLKAKNSGNIDDITIAEKYDTELKVISNVDDAVASLYVTPTSKSTIKNNASTVKLGTVNTNTTISSTKVALGITLSRPVSGIITSRFGERSRIRSSAHTGLDIAASYGTLVTAAADGKVTFAGRKGSYGNLMVITHTNGVQTYYGHCKALYCKVGDTVTAGQTIAAVGSTGNSTGPHLHFEIRVNGIAYNPQNYLY